MSGRLSARAWNTRASVYMPVPAIAQAMRAPKGPVAVANRPGRLKIPAPTIEPMTIAVSEESGSFCSVVEDTEGVDDAVEDVISLPLISQPRTRASGSEDYTRALWAQDLRCGGHDATTWFRCKTWMATIPNFARSMPSTLSV